MTVWIFSPSAATIVSSKGCEWVTKQTHLRAKRGKLGKQHPLMSFHNALTSVGNSCGRPHLAKELSLFHSPRIQMTQGKKLPIVKTTFNSITVFTPSHLELVTMDCDTGLTCVSPDLSLIPAAPSCQHAGSPKNWSIHPSHLNGRIMQSPPLRSDSLSVFSVDGGVHLTPWPLIIVIKETENVFYSGKSVKFIQKFRWW